MGKKKFIHFLLLTIKIIRWTLELIRICKFLHVSLISMESKVRTLLLLIFFTFYLRQKLSNLRKIKT